MHSYFQSQSGGHMGQKEWLSIDIITGAADNQDNKGCGRQAAFHGNLKQTEVTVINPENVN